MTLQIRARGALIGLEAGRSIFMDNPAFRRWLADAVFAQTYQSTLG